MTYEEEAYIIKILKRIRDETHENNKLLKENNKILKYLASFVNYINNNARKENEDDFNRNVLANLISSQFELFFNKR